MRKQRDTDFIERETNFTIYPKFLPYCKIRVSPKLNLIGSPYPIYTFTPSET